jgi:hypothetical protein
VGEWESGGRGDLETGSNVHFVILSAAKNLFCTMEILRCAQNDETPCLSVPHSPHLPVSQSPRLVLDTEELHEYA